MRLSQSVNISFFFALAATQCEAGTAPKQINFGLPKELNFGTPSISFPAFLNPVKSIQSYLQRPSVFSELQNRIIELERKIRSSKEEARQLRALLNSQLKERRKYRSDDNKKSVEVEKILKEQVRNLNIRIEVLSQTKGELEALLKREKLEVIKLENMLEDERKEKDNLIQKHRHELDDLRKTLVKKSENQLKELEKDIVSKMTAEIDRLKKDAIAAQQALVMEKAKNEKLVAQNENLEKEIKVTQEALDKSKMRMRKLVKVLVNKEKQEIASSSSASVGDAITQSASNKMKTTKVISHRGSKP